jgi:hypothetical protein
MRIIETAITIYINNLSFVIGYQYYKVPTLNYNRENSVIIKYQPSIITERTALL